jgi:hypothetical protein
MIILDCETYSNYFLASFLNSETNKTLSLEKFNDAPLDRKLLLKVMTDKLTGSFNGEGYDLLIVAFAIMGASNAKLKELSDKIILSDDPAWMIARDNDIQIPPQWDHVDIMNVAQGQASLKIYGGRLNAPKLQDLPIEPDTILTREQADAIRVYCDNDLFTTKLLFDHLAQQLTLRGNMSEQYGIDLRSKSDAQIAEAVIKSELTKITQKQYYRPRSIPKSFNYNHPAIVNFKTKALNDIFQRILAEKFTLRSNGAVKMPLWLANMQIGIRSARYQMGIGGLHSCEKKQYIMNDAGFTLCELDVASYYPAIILQQKLAPSNLGEAFLDVYRSIVERRLGAKASGDKVTADTLKIVVNGSFGKLGSKWSALYAPELLIQTTMTGQLALLMLIERLEIANFSVVSANTDGIVCHFATDRTDEFHAIHSQWEAETTFVLEQTDYSQIASRDVNNYIAIKTDGSTKGKGVFASRSLAKNPEFLIIYEAVEALLCHCTPLRTTIEQCTDITKFVAVRRVTGGAVWRDELLGKAIRYYYSNDVPADESIRYKKNNNKVPKSDGARPLMDLPDTFPNDVNFNYYETLANKVLVEIGYA